MSQSSGEETPEADGLAGDAVSASSAGETQAGHASGAAAGQTAGETASCCAGQARQPDEDIEGRKMKLGGFVLRTLLDPDAMLKVFKSASAGKEAKLKELSQAPGEFKPKKVVEKFRPANSCDQNWKKLSGTDRIRFCEACKLQVYNFLDMDDEEAEAAVFQREAIGGATLYRRRDGTFLTQDCPVGAKRKRAMVIAAAMGALLLVGSFVVVSSMPPPEERGSTQSPDVAASDSKAKAESETEAADSESTKVSTIDDRTVSNQSPVNAEPDQDLVEAEQERKMYEQMVKSPQPADGPSNSRIEQIYRQWTYENQPRASQ
jgi:hypothetical protein